MIVLYIKNHNNFVTYVSYEELFTIIIRTRAFKMAAYMHAWQMVTCVCVWIMNILGDVISWRNATACLLS